MHYDLSLQRIFKFELASTLCEIHFELRLQ